jgi:hypothetical protein
MEIAAEIEAADETPMDEEAVESELRSRRGGYSPNGAASFYFTALKLAGLANRVSATDLLNSTES